MLLQGREKAIPATWAWKKMMRFVVIFISVAGFAALLWPSSDEHNTLLYTPSNITISKSVKCDPDLETLRRLDVKTLAAYTRREMLVNITDESLPITHALDMPLLSMKNTKTSQHVGVEEISDGCTVPIPVSVQVPQPPKLADASHIDFGVATTISRLNDSLDQFAHWAGYTRTRIFALVEPEKDSGNGVNYLRTKADALGINLVVTVSDDDYLYRYFALVPLLQQNMRESTRWGCIIDDDTFFISMAALVDAMDGYDHTKPMYVGGLSEGMPQIAVFGMIAFGGAGVFLSRPLLNEITAVYNECEQMTYTGDRRLANCIYQYTTTRLTVDHRLRQLDLMKDASGFFESGREPPLSVHHWKSWFESNIPKLAVISNLCGDTCLLRRWFFNDNWYLTNGFSIVQYGFENTPAPNDITMEMSWEPHNGATDESYLHELGPLRRKDDGKVSYLLEDAIVDSDGRVRQWYIKRDSKNGDEIIELLWRKQ
ncbi:hypothetical protein N7495_004454 [Penicillium taxi]|uniref:uncharacterized protein n=1 Tax=Penicillium taxi TaxID=168475 RepID=UPI0025459D96|nr:uncharacterized protein N7495_004454 [Penicillium taxi]KAJ5899710.1 hypothetical protein N7495_004454 [Penicillium taxi]